MMPETAVHKDYSFIFWQHNVRSARQFAYMQSKAKTCSMQKGANGDFRFCVFASNSAHDPAALGWREYVSHRFDCTALCCVLSCIRKEKKRRDRRDRESKNKRRCFSAAPLSV
jgi:hypothetical protein